MKVALVQMNPTVGAVAANAANIVQFARDAAAAGAAVAIFPEMALSGYPPDDLALRPRFMDAVMAELEKLAADLPADLLVVVGTPLREGDQLFNAAALYHGGRQVGVARKIQLAKYGAFDERRIFTPGTTPLIHEFGGLRWAIQIGEDSWWPERTPQAAGLKGKCDAVLHLAASPYCRDGELERERMACSAAAAAGAPLLCVNLVGGQDELVFDGCSAAVDPERGIVARAGLFREGMLIAELASAGTGWALVPGTVAERPAAMAVVYEALAVGLRDYVNKNNFPGVIIALSGGLDSALVAAIAVDALGPERVFGMTLPSAITSQETFADALDLAQRLGIPCLEIPIAPAVEALCKSTRKACADVKWAEPLPNHLVTENLQARVRGVLAMALSNCYGYMVLATGNKSEMSTGYTTLYGDMCGGFALIKDVFKTTVFELAHWRNRQSEVIPPSTIARPPSAELKPDQRDSDSLPPYDVLDPILERYVERQMRVADIVADGFDEQTVRKVVRLVDRSEYKRRQAAPGVNITPKAFGRDRRLPITNGFRE